MSATPQQHVPPTQQHETRPAFKIHAPRATAAVLIGFLLYAGLYGYLEMLTYRYGDSNPFFRIATTASDPDLLILGASRALPLTFGTMQLDVEDAVGGKVLNLAMEGAGVIPNYLVLDYFLANRQAQHAVYFLDSFVFYDPEWNEQRLTDASLWQRVPLNWSLIQRLWHAVSHLGLDRAIFWNYLTGFSKMNDLSSWYKPDKWESESRFENVYRTNARHDRGRLERLYSGPPEQEVFDRYLAIFLQMMDRLREHSIAVTVVKPPLRQSFYEKIPGEVEFDERLRDSLAQRGIPFYDFSLTGFPDSLFFDPDHLNDEGVRRFLNDHLAPLLRSAQGVDQPVL